MTNAALLTTEAVLKALDTRFAARREGLKVPRGPEHRSNPYLIAASVLHAFNVAELNPHPEGQDEAARLAIFDVTVPAIGWRNERLRSLTIEARQNGLRALGNRPAM